MADFTYMGTKKQLAPRIAELVASMGEGPFLDLFSGIAAVGSQVAVSRSVWCNDVQHFSTLLTTQKFAARKAFRSATAIAATASPYFSRNRTVLERGFAGPLAEEVRALADADAAIARELIVSLAQTSRAKRASLTADGWHCLFTLTHAGTYLGVRQAIDVDSVRHAADQMLVNGMVDAGEHRWMILALCQVISTISNSTGHFAQYLSPSENNIRRVVRKRRMTVWTLWSEILQHSQPLGTVAWRRRNRIFQGNAVDVLRSLSGKVRQPAVIYADPPYTSDQYSRYYHLLENAVLYDYPETSGKGQYRPDRFNSGFSLKSGVSAAFEELVAAAAELRSVFVLSYPTNGLLKSSKARVLEILSRYFAHVEAPLIVSHLHSTMGASKGAHKQAVEENIFVAYQNPTQRHRCREAERAHYEQVGPLAYPPLRREELAA